MSSFQQLNPQLISPMVLREGKDYRLPVKVLAAAGFCCSASVEGAGVDARFEQDELGAVDQVDPSSLVVGSPSEQFLVIRAQKHGSSQLLLCHARPWMQEDPLAEKIIIEVQVVSLAAQNAWEDQAPVSPISDDEIKQFLDKIDGSRPYGARKFALVRSILDILAKDIAVHLHAGTTYELENWKVDGISKLLPAELFPRHPTGTLGAALTEFVQARKSI